jgi:hypothetical protein
MEAATVTAERPDEENVTETCDVLTLSLEIPATV